MGVMAVGLFITIFLLFHRISSSKLVRKGFSMIFDFSSRDEGSSSIDIVHPINLRSKTQQELVEAAKELNETREKNAEVERELRSENIELRADLATKITELRAQMNRTTTFLGLDGWLYLEKTASWYKVIDQIMTFDEAEQYCANRKSHLVSIHSQEENDFVQKLANTLYSNACFWVGLKRNPNKGNAFEWTDGSSVDFTNWRSGEPDSNTHAFLWSSHGRWAVENPIFEPHFICKCSSQF